MDNIIRNMSDLLWDIENSQVTISLVHENINHRILGTADVIRLTTTELAKHVSVLYSINAKVVICKEAAEVLKTYILGTFMSSVQHFILIGNHEQLKLQIRNYNLFLIKSNWGKQYQFNHSLFEWLAREPTGQYQIPIIQLNIQRRMRPEISRLIRDTLYFRLVNHPDTKSLPNVSGIKKNVFWYYYMNPEASPQYSTEKKSHSNNFKVQITSALMHHIIW